MKAIKYFIITGLAAVSISMVSCTKNFSEINTNPNGSSLAAPEALLAPALYDVVTKNQTRALRLTNELMQDHVTTINSDEIHRYVIRPSESDYMWNNWYLQLTNFKDMYKGAAILQQKSLMGMALIMDAWVTSLITDLFGDVPYSEANMGKNNIYTPKFDSQKDIYTSILDKLDTANVYLAANQALTADQKPLDPLYAGDIAKWRKFGNSLLLRLLLRVSGKPEMNAGARIKKMVETSPATYPIFTTNDESAILRFTTTAPYVSAFNTYRDYDFNGDNGLAEFFINNLKDWGDPRIAKWAAPVGGQYLGIPSGYASGAVPDRKSYYPAALKDEPLLGNIINYSEVQFILAEAAVRGYISGNPKTYYDNGITNGITLWGYTVPANYLNGTDIMWNAGGSDGSKLEQIHLQKYYAMFFTDFQQWNEYRRTGHPVLPIGPGVLNNGKMPARFKYPVSVQSLNRANYEAAVAAMGGPDDLNTKMWWNK
ncbi:SusD/RagB family nutrient-binding outer membrane lipoprotein [Sediminibacterium ginsengisoli]|uniref:Starch-binding associating with outer membrane n=1 Tax=Sediminibacterium ginsengisoli TaxID=413434 RepID=A0A1T4M3J5_9BACT|nr:SusD/RagB family nutrient-binding outer membrane lipoprotein [Sediminibacterium ginsengisoli]SJZ61512.1 Starch-binding associating with outer membrane [Sediminibacterium ginsengisoli]